MELDWDSGEFHVTWQDGIGIGYNAGHCDVVPKLKSAQTNGE